MKILTVVGARPQLIKAIAVTRALSSRCNEVIVHTGQHYNDNMSRVFLDELVLPQPRYNLSIGSGSHAEQTGQMLIKLEKVIIDEKPDWVLVYGDTNSTLAGALTAAKLNIPCAHVEAGLRSFNRAMAEEINRLICDRVCKMLFCPSQNAVRLLEEEGIVDGVYFTGDVMLDVMKIFLPRVQNDTKILKKLHLQKNDYVLATIHRAENTDDIQRLNCLLDALGKLGVKVICPFHPRTQKAIQMNGLHLANSIVSIQPLGYLDMLCLEVNAACILTDSGGMQKEAYWLGVQCITLREETEWIETVQAGWNILTGMNEAVILDAFKNWVPPTERPEYFGDGNSAQIIACHLLGKASEYER